MRLGTAQCFVLANNVTGEVVDVFTLVAPHFQFGYLIESLQDQCFGTRAAAVLVEHYFGCANEEWLGDSGLLTAAGAGLIRKLCFENGRLTRKKWQRLAARFAKLFR